ncbi:MAG: NYN domain-containing protein [Lysobacterales bacterium]|nr:MAG: NYN domain-containing protein [Xanthomonadales bacterium]
MDALRMALDYNNTARSALFVDLENLIINSRKIGLSIDFDRLINRLAQYGKLSVRRSFGDLDKAIRNEPRLRQPIRSALMRCMIQHEDVLYLTEHKNSADIRLVVEALSISYQYPDIHTFILVSSDRDYLPLIAKLRELGRTVVGVGITPDATNEFYIKACDEFIYYESLFRQDEIHTTSPASTNESNQEEIDISLIVLDDYCRLLFEAVSAVEQRSGRCSGGSAYSLMRQLRPDLDLNRAGLGAFRELAKEAEKLGLVKIEYQAGSDFLLSRTKSPKPVTATESARNSEPESIPAKRIEHILQERLKCKPLPEPQRLTIYKAAEKIIKSTDGGIKLNTLKEQVLEAIPAAGIEENQLYKLLYTIYRRGAFLCEAGNSHYDPKLFAIATPPENWDQLYLIAMLSVLSVANPAIEMKAEQLAVILCGSTERTALLQDCLERIGC